MEGDSVKAVSVELPIPDFTREDYLTTTAPYEWLYKFRQNKFVAAQLLARMNSSAKVLRVTNFLALWKAYISSVGNGRNTDGGNTTMFSDQPAELACGDYICDDAGVTYIDRYGAEADVICHPLMPIRRLVDIDCGVEQIELAYRPGAEWRTVIAARTTVASAAKIIELAQYGMAVTSENAKAVVKYLSDVEALNYSYIPEQRSVGRLGWISSDKFAPYCDKLTFSGEQNYKTFFDAVSPTGDREKWIDEVKAIRAGGNIPARIMLAASFASVLVEPCQALPFYVHLWGDTGCGKTVALMLAASVWANPSLGRFVTSYNSTVVGREMTAGFVNSLPLCLDELQIQTGDKSAEKDVYRLTEGLGKIRGAAGGGLQNTLRWRCCIMTTGEAPITHSSTAGGAMSRIIEVNYGNAPIFADPQHVVSVITDNYGFAGQEFVEMLLSPRGLDMARQAREYYQTLLLSSTDTVGKIAISASIILAADKLAEAWIFKDNCALSVEDVASVLVKSDEADQNKRCHDWISELVAQNPVRFMPNDFGEYSGEVWGCIDADYTYIIKSVFEAKLSEQGFSAASYCRWAKSRGLIECSADRYYRRKRIPGTPSISGSPVWCACVKSSNGK